jgi:3-dehydroquinate synthase II
VLAAAGKTTYLSEVVAGDKLLVATTSGATREATVGRAKVEPRPCVKVDAARGGASGSVFLQQAETVRLAGVAGPLPVTRARVGDEILVRPDDKGTHMGQRISVPVEER